MAKGWISLSRQIQEHWIWNDSEPFDMRSAWIDLLLMANHEDVKKAFNGRIVICKRGTIFRSILSLSKRWKWDRKKVSKFLDILESDGMVTTKRTTEGTTITIVNYNKFQVCGTTKRTTDGTTIGQPLDTNNNDNNVKQFNNKRNQFNGFQKQSYDFANIERMLEQQ